MLDREVRSVQRPAGAAHPYPEGNGSQTRPIGILTFEDMILQRAVALALRTVNEQASLPRSYGLRPAPSAHDALEALWQQLMPAGASGLASSGRWSRSVA